MQQQVLSDTPLQTEEAEETAEREHEQTLSPEHPSKRTIIEEEKPGKKKKKKKGLQLHNKNESKTETALKQIVQESMKLGEP